MPHSAVARRGSQRTGSPFDPIPGRDVVYNIARLEDSGGSEDMVVDGSVTPVDFDYAPATDEIDYVESLMFMIDDNGNVPPNKYGSIATALTNGVQVLIQTMGTEYEIANMLTNADVSHTFVRSGFSAGGGWLASTNLYFGELQFFVPMALDETQGDYVRIKVRDDLSKLSFQYAHVKVWRVP